MIVPSFDLETTVEEIVLILRLSHSSGLELIRAFWYENLLFQDYIAQRGYRFDDIYVSYQIDKFNHRYINEDEMFKLIAEYTHRYKRF